MTKAIIGSEFVKEIIPMIDQATKKIDICVFDWRWYADDPANPAQLFNNAIVRAVKRGLIVRVVTNMEDTIKILSGLNICTVKPSTKRLIHPKMMIIDYNYVVIGSHNYTQSAFTTNYEVSVILEKPQCIGNLQEFFNNLYLHG